MNLAINLAMTPAGTAPRGVMTRLAAAALLAATCAALPGTAFAQGTCPAGRAANGQCVNAAFAAAVTQSAVITSQPKLSYTHYPVLPSFDWIFRYPNQLNPDPLKPSPTTGPTGGPFITP
jgi:hypothetical protein